MCKALSRRAEPSVHLQWFMDAPFGHGKMRADANEIGGAAIENQHQEIWAIR